MPEKSVKPLTAEEIAAAEAVAKDLERLAKENQPKEVSKLRQQLVAATQLGVISPKTARNVGLPPFSPSLEESEESK